VSKGQGLTVSFDGRDWQAVSRDGQIIALTAGEEQWLPELPEGFVCEHLILPLEAMVSRVFHLPLKNPRLLDADILAQELDDRADVEPDAWWLAWHAAKNLTSGTEQVVGMVFAMPMAWKQALEASPAWQQASMVGIDACFGLQRYIENSARLEMDESATAVFDADQDGVFFGLWQNGAWLGMRRINRDGRALEDMVEDIKHSLSAMGHDVELAYAATGLLDDGLLTALDFQEWTGTTEVIGNLPGRHAANRSRLASLPTDSRVLNFRHGRWSVTGFSQIRLWKRALLLATLLLLLWLLGMAWQHYTLSRLASIYQQQIISAFHQGLPEEKAMIDPLAQLRRAVGGGKGVSTSDSGLPQQLAAVHHAYKKTTWDMRELEWSDGRMTIVGKTDSLQTLNRVRQTLQQQTGTEIKLLDTDLNGKQVRFRIQWP